MGSVFEIQLWKPYDDGRVGYGYQEFWRGDSLILAVWNIFKAKRTGYVSVLYWR